MLRLGGESKAFGNMGKDRELEIGRNDMDLLEPRRLRLTDKRIINQRTRRKWREALRNSHRVRYMENWWTDYD